MCLEDTPRLDLGQKKTQIFFICDATVCSSSRNFAFLLHLHARLRDPTHSFAQERMRTLRRQGALFGLWDSTALALFPL